MRIPRIYVEQSLQGGKTLELTKAQTHYISKVLRMECGRELTLFNGKGGEFQARLKLLEKNHCDVLIGEFLPQNRLPNIDIELAICISRGDKMDWLVQKSTELGVKLIRPVFSERTEVKLTGARLDKKLEHWRNIAISACEQCRRNLVPEIGKPLPFLELISGTTSQFGLIFHHEVANSFQQLVQTMQTPPSSVTLLVGPEGGLSDLEISHAQAKGFIPTAMGPRVMRTETAPIAALSVIQHIWGDFNV